MQPLPPAVERTTYRIVAEAITNTIKHAGAETLQVGLKQRLHPTSPSTGAAKARGELTIRIDDDGVGGAALSAGAGLRGMALRAAAHGGTLEVDSPPGGGTKLTVTLAYPLGREVADGVGSNQPDQAVSAQPTDSR